MTDKPTTPDFSNLESIDQWIQAVKANEGATPVSEWLPNGEKVTGGSIRGREGAFPDLGNLSTGGGDFSGIGAELMDVKQAVAENPGNLIERLEDAEREQRAASVADVEVDDLADLSPTSGESRSGRTIHGEGTPEEGDFTGVGIGFPPIILPDGSVWSIIGMEGGVLQFALRASDGRAIAGAGAVQLGVDGIRILNSRDGESIQFEDVDGDPFMRIWSNNSDAFNFQNKSNRDKSRRSGGFYFILESKAGTSANLAIREDLEDDDVMQVDLPTGTAGGKLTATGLDIRYSAAIGTQVGYMSHVHASQPSAQALANNSIVQIAFATEQHDALGEWNGNTFTALYPGYYHVAAALVLANNTGWNAGETFSLYLYKNGAAYSRLARYVFTGAASLNVGLNIGGDDTVHLYAGETCDVRALQASGGSINLSADGTLNHIAIDRMP